MQHNIYRCDLTLHDYLFFASTERGKIAETGPFVHNYALTYALGWSQVVWYNSEQKARYLTDLGPIQDRYITPARLVRGAGVIVQYNTLGEKLRTNKPQSIGYPDWGFIKCFKPGTLFRAYVMFHEQETLPRYIRLGKFMAKTRLEVVAAKHVEQRQGVCKVSQMLNWSDLREKPVSFNVRATSLPSRLISQASFEDIAFLHVTFSDSEEVNLPLEMGYLAGV